MSSLGFSISVVKKFDVGAILDLEVYLTDAGQPASVKAEVCWIRISEYFKEVKREHYDVGLKICTPKGKDFDLIDEYVKQHTLDI